VAAPSAESSTPSAAPATSAPASAASAECSTPLVEQTEGPYYTPSAPERTDITAADTVGIPLLLTGRVLTADCTPVAGMTIEFWQADGAGVYDNEGYALRGSQATTADGGYTLETVIPGLYPSRTEHIHVKVTGPDGVVHTTQLYFPDVPQNDEDGIFSPTMLVTVTEQSEDAMVATFDFVLP
jgi:protocatechuate 3,4-dioxygenase beta subunit